MKIAVLKEAPGETRCAAIPETVKKFVALGADVAVENAAGDDASISDADFEAAGAKIGSRPDVLKGAGIILCINGPDPQTLKDARKGALLVGGSTPRAGRRPVKGSVPAGFEPWRWGGWRGITGGQPRDSLSSQRNLAGSKR